jgi:hypothetical protein
MQIVGNLTNELINPNQTYKIKKSVSPGNALLNDKVLGFGL